MPGGPGLPRREDAERAGTTVPGALRDHRAAAHRGRRYGAAVTHPIHPSVAVWPPCHARRRRLPGHHGGPPRRCRPGRRWNAGTVQRAAEAELISLTNQARASAGLRTLKLDSKLPTIARWRSKDMIDRDYFRHDPGRGSVFWYMQYKGYCFKLAGENIGWNTVPGRRRRRTRSTSS